MNPFGFDVDLGLGVSGYGDCCEVGFGSSAYKYSAGFLWEAKELLDPVYYLFVNGSFGKGEFLGTIHACSQHLSQHSIWGTCASYGGIQSVGPNPTGAVGVYDALTGEHLRDLEETGIGGGLLVVP